MIKNAANKHIYDNIKSKSKISSDIRKTRPVLPFWKELNQNIERDIMDICSVLACTLAALLE